MRRSLIYLFALAATLPAQISVVVSKGSRLETRQEFGKRFSKTAVGHGVFLKNLGTESVSIKASATYDALAHLEPLPDKRVSVLLDQAERTSGWARAGRLAGDLSKGTAILTAAKVVKINESWPSLLFVGLPVVGEYVAGRLRGEAVPTRANYGRVAWLAPVEIAPGDSAETVVFTALESTEVLRFTLDSTNAPLRRSLR